MADSAGSTHGFNVIEGGGSGSGGSVGSGGGMSGDGPGWKEYIDAQDEKTRAQNDARFAEVMAGISGVGDRLDLQRNLLADTKAAADEAKGAAEQAMVAASNTKWNILATALAVVGILFAAWALWAQGVEMITGILTK